MECGVRIVNDGRSARWQINAGPAAERHRLTSRRAAAPAAVVPADIPARHTGLPGDPRQYPLPVWPVRGLGPAVSRAGTDGLSRTGSTARCAHCRQRLPIWKTRASPCTALTNSSACGCPLPANHWHAWHGRRSRAADNCWPRTFAAAPVQPGAPLPRLSSRFSSTRGRFPPWSRPPRASNKWTGGMPISPTTSPVRSASPPVSWLISYLSVRLCRNTKSGSDPQIPCPVRAT